MSQPSQAQFFGHPRGLSTLFFTELWERFSYYGMRGLLVLFMTDLVANGGMGMTTVKASAIVGLYTFGVYALALPGGWMADRLLGKKKAVLWGGVLIAAGHYTLAVPNDMAFYTGLVLVVLGTGLLKPNVSAIVGDLYGDDGAKRDAGFSLFYMGINLGAFLGPIICGWLGEGYSWHMGFGAAGVGMTLALIQYVHGGKYLVGAGELEVEAGSDQHRKDWRNFYIGFGSIVAAIVVFVMLMRSGAIPLSLVEFVRWTGGLVVLLVAIYFGYVLAFECRNADEKKRILVIVALFFGAAMFWSGFEQAATGLNAFANDLTNRVVFGWEAPASWLQSINPMFIIIMAPVVGFTWVKLGSRAPSLGVKFGLGLVLLGVGFLVLAWGATFTGDGLVSPMWLVVTYFFHTVGELCLSPVGLSATTKISPSRLVGQMMGIWFMGSALGNLIAGLVGGLVEDLPLSSLFIAVGGIAAGAGLLFFVISGPIKRLAGDNA